jgi:hypothetical protein
MTSDLVELVGPRGPALGAWAVLDPAVAPGTVPLDLRGQRIVGVAAGERLHVRPLRRSIVS